MLTLIPHTVLLSGAIAFFLVTMMESDDTQLGKLVVVLFGGLALIAIAFTIFAVPSFSPFHITTLE